MKKLLFLFLPLAALLAGCEKENNETHGQDSFNRLVKEVICECWSFEAGDEKFVFEFKYDDKNRLCYVAEKIYYKNQLYGDNVYRYTYKPNKLTILGDMNQENETSETHFAVTYTYRFDNDLMVSESNENSWGTGKSASFYYNNAGFLSRVVEEYTWSGDVVDLSVSWNNGNMVGPNVYSSYKNKANLDFSSLMWGDYDPKSDRNVFKGIHNKNLVEQENDGDYLLLYSYEFDQFGYPVKIEASDNKGWGSTKLYIQYYQ